MLPDPSSPPFPERGAVLEIDLGKYTFACLLDIGVARAGDDFEDLDSHE